MKQLALIVFSVLSFGALAQENGAEEISEPSPRKRLLIPADPSAPYFILERDGGANRYRAVTVKRVGKENSIYARLAFDCQRNTVRVLGEGRTYYEMKKSTPSSAPAKIAERSVHDYIGTDVCRGYVVDQALAAAESRAEENAKYAYTRREVVTLSDYQSVYTGMNYREVEKTLGRPGREVSRSYLPGIHGATVGISTVMYEWVNRDGSNMNAMFQDGRLVQKAQFGLR